MDDGWILIPNWDEFQHYKDRDPAWIKEYLRQLNNPAWRALSFHRRGVLHSLRLGYAATSHLPATVNTLNRLLGATMQARDLESLNHAGFIEVSASKPLASRYSGSRPEKRREALRASLPEERARARTREERASERVEETDPPPPLPDQALEARRLLERLHASEPLQ